MIKTGQRFAGYELEELIGEGGMGVIYRARDVRLQRPVALRIVAADVARDPVTRARLNRELTSLAAVDHPNIAPVYEAGENSGQLFIATRWVEGTNLGLLVRDQGPLAPRRAVRIVNQVASALQAVHARGIIHRNVKPSSILVTSVDHAYLTDFGLARRLTDLGGLTVQQQLVEPFDYVAPEYIEGDDTDERVDIYGLGCILYEALTGEVPFPGSAPAAKLYAHRTSRPPSARRLHADVPPALDLLIARSLAKSPAERPSANEFALDAAAAVDMSVPPWVTHEGGEEPPGLVAGPARAPGPAVEAAPIGSAAPAPASQAEDGAQYSERVIYRTRRRLSGRFALRALGVVAFLAPATALLIALAHNGAT